MQDNAKKHRYRRIDGESAIALDRYFMVRGPSDKCCGVVTQIWVRNRHIYLDALMDFLHTALSAGCFPISVTHRSTHMRYVRPMSPSFSATVDVSR